MQVLVLWETQKKLVGRTEPLRIFSAILKSGFTLLWKAGSGTILQWRVWVTKIMADFFACPPSTMSHSLHRTLLLTSVKCGLALFVCLAHLHRTCSVAEGSMGEPADYTGSFDPRYAFTYHRSELLLLQGRQLAAQIWIWRSKQQDHYRCLLHAVPLYSFSYHQECRCIAEGEIYSCTPKQRKSGVFVSIESFKSPCPSGFHSSLVYPHVWVVWSFSCRLPCLTSPVVLWQQPAVER